MLCNGCECFNKPPGLSRHTPPHQGMPDSPLRSASSFERRQQLTCAAVWKTTSTSISSPRAASRRCGALLTRWTRKTARSPTCRPPTPPGCATTTPRGLRASASRSRTSRRRTAMRWWRWQICGRGISSPTTASASTRPARTPRPRSAGARGGPLCAHARREISRHHRWPARRAPSCDGQIARLAPRAVPRRLKRQSAADAGADGAAQFPFDGVHVRVRWAQLDPSSAGARPHAQPGFLTWVAALR